jgi:hypothetical protein
MRRPLPPPHSSHLVTVNEHVQLRLGQSSTRSELASVHDVARDLESALSRLVLPRLVSAIRAIVHYDGTKYTIRISAETDQLEQIVYSTTSSTSSPVRRALRAFTLLMPSVQDLTDF